MDQEETVETSDAEERETEHATSFEYWTRATADTHRQQSPIHVSTPGGIASPSLAQCTQPTTSGHADGESSRKRIKIHHDSPLSASPCAPDCLEVSTTSIQSSAGSTTSRVPDTIYSSRPSNLLANVPLHLLETSSTQCEENEPQRNDTSEPVHENSQDPLLLDSEGLASVTQPKSYGVPHTLLGPHDDKETGSVRRHSRSKSPSVDPLYLASSPPRTPARSVALFPADRESIIYSTTPTETGRQEIECSLFTPRTAGSFPHYSSLTPPPSSQPRLPPTSVAPSSPEHEGSPRSRSSQPLHNDDDPIIPPDLDLSRRYSLRTRQAKQINPYAYDKIVYKQQMRANPEAIVKVVSPRNRSHGHRGGEAEEGTQMLGEWMIDGEVDVDEDDEWRERERRRERRASSGKGEANARASESSGRYPELLRHSHSSDDDDDKEIKEVRRAAKRAREERKRKETEEKKRKAKEDKEKWEADERERKRRKKAFPLRERALSKGSSDIAVPDSSHRRMSREQTASPTLSTSALREASHYSESGSIRPQYRSATKPLSPPTLSPTVSADRSPDAENLKYEYHPEYDDWAGHPEEGMVVDFGGPLQFPSSPEDSQRNSPIVITSDDDEKVSEPTVPEDNDSASEKTADSSSSRKMSSRDRKRLRALKRMMPAAMINRQFGKAPQPQSRRQRSATAEQVSDIEEGPLLPGQTRVRMGERPPSSSFDFRGDPESSDHEPMAFQDNANLGFASRSDSDVELLHRPRQWKRRSSSHGGVSPEVVDIEDSDDEDSSDDDVDDAKINAWLGDRPHPCGTTAQRTTHVREENLIDWMLTRTRTVGAVKQRSRRRNVRSTVRPRNGTGASLDVVTSGARRLGHERQTTLLDFSKVHTTKPISSRGGGGSHHSRSSHGGQHVADSDDTEEEIDSPIHFNVHPMNATDAAVTKRKRKRHRAEQRGLYIFPSNGTRITSGRASRRMESAIAIDIEDEGFRNALAPIPHGVRNGAQSKPNPKSSLFTPGFVQEQDEDFPADHDHPHNLQGHWDKSTERHRHIKLDFGISFLPSGITFGATTYLGKGWLHELTALISGNKDIAMPAAYSALDFDLGPSMGFPNFLASMPSIFDRLFDDVTKSTDHHSAEHVKEWERLMRVLCLLVSWFIVRCDEEGEGLHITIQEQILRLVTRIEDRYDAMSTNGASMDMLVLSVYWFAVELLTRVGCCLQDKQPGPDTHVLVKFVLLLMRRLREFGLQRTIDSIRGCEATLDDLSAPQRTAELWICLFHLVNSCDVHLLGGSPSSHVHPFWKMIQQALESDGSALSGLEASENIWRLIFSLCALSQFSIHGMTTSSPRLPASWELVAFALKQIQLAADPSNDCALSEGSLDKRDDYIWLITSRCFTLWNRWRWHLNQASVMFNQLIEIFKSRKFANLRREPSDFPGFMLENDMRLLSQYKSSDTAFELFLKLVVQAAKEGRPDGNQGAKVSPKLTKLLSLAIPVGSVPFTKSTPPSVHELSMLYNRLSAVAVAIYLDPTPKNIQNRMAHARRYVHFKDADDTTRIACIRGMMHFAILLQYRRLSLDEVITWLAEMTEILVNEYREIDLASKASGMSGTNVSRDRAIFSIQVLLGSVRRIIETPQMDPTQPRTIYPDPSLLDGPWVTRIFSNSTDLANISKTGLEIRRLIQAFLDARSVVMPTPPRPRPVAIAQDGNHESQDEYGILELDLDDPELLAALGDQGDSQLVVENKMKDELVCKVIDTHISPAIYRLVCKHFKDPLNTNSIEDYCYDAEKWVDCWVGCANVVVQNKKRDWSLYLTLGPQSWERIIDTSWRRRVGLRFMFVLLQLDPTAYETYKDRFMDVLLESMVSGKVTLENAYVSLLFSIDGLQHPLLHGIPCQRTPEASDYNISKAAFLTLRLPIIETMCTNLNGTLQKEIDGEKALTGYNQTCLGFFVTMLSTMQDVYQMFETGSQDHITYTDFCHRIIEMIAQHARLKDQPRLSNWMNWGLKVFNGQ